MANQPLVTSDPEYLHGEPLFSGTHIPVRLIVTLLECGELEGDLEIAYPKLTQEMLAYARTLSESAPLKHHLSTATLCDGGMRLSDHAR